MRLAPFIGPAARLSAGFRNARTWYRFRRGSSLLLGAAVILVGAGRTRAADPISSLMKGPLIRISERTVDLGRMPQHASRSHDFLIRNDGTEDLHILKVTPDCGCTLAEPAANVIAPRDSTTVHVVFNSGDFEREQHKVVILETDDPAEPRVELLLTSYVAPEVEVATRLLDFGPARRGTTPVLSTTMTADPGVPFSVRTPVGAEDVVTWTVAPDPGSGPNTWKVEAHLRPDAPLGRFNERAEVPLDHPRKKSERLNVRGFVHGYFRPLDVAIGFGTLTAGTPQSRTIRLAADGPGDFRIVGAQASVPWLTTSLKRDGKDYLLIVKLDSREPRRIKETITVQTTDPGQPEITLDVRGSVR